MPDSDVPEHSQRRIFKISAKFLPAPLFATLVTVLIIVAGLAGSIYSAEVRRSFPFYWGPGELCVHALIFWLLAIAAAAAFFFREHAVTAVQQGLQERALTRAEQLERLMRTLPPVIKRFIVFTIVAIPTFIWRYLFDYGSFWHSLMAAVFVGAIYCLLEALLFGKRVTENPGPAPAPKLASPAEPIDKKNSRLETFLKIIQILAILTTAFWAIFTFGFSKFSEFVHVWDSGVFLSPTVRVEQLSEANSPQPRYLVTVTTELQNNRDRSRWLNAEYLNFYLGTLDPASTGFVSPLSMMSDKSMIKWSRFSTFVMIENDYEEKVKQKGKQDEFWTDIASVESDKKSVYRFQHFELPGNQSTIFENKFVITASPNDWIGIDTHFVTDRFTIYGAVLPYERVDNIGLKLRESTVAATQGKQVARPKTVRRMSTPVPSGLMQRGSAPR